MLVQNNYYQCCYNNDLSHIVRKDLFDKWMIKFDLSSFEKRKPKSFKEELISSCELMYESLYRYTKSLNIFLSGGTDSECLIRCFVEAKIPVRPIIIVHKHTPDSDETKIAFEICEELNLTPIIFNVDLLELCQSGKFYDMGMRYQTPRMGMLELLYVLEKLEEPAILGDEIKLVKKSINGSLLNIHEENSQQWFFYIEEDQDGVFNRYQNISGIPMIPDSFRFTPQCWAAMLLTDRMKDIVLNERGKASGLTSKNLMMREEFGIRYREKTNVFIDGPHRKARNELFFDLSSKLFPFRNLNIEYTELLETLKVDYDLQRTNR